jgi:hypothetical protein
MSMRHPLLAPAQLLRRPLKILNARLPFMTSLMTSRMPTTMTL